MNYRSVSPAIKQSSVCQVENIFDILKSTENDAERTTLKHVVCSGYNLSRRQASSMYKISRMKERAIAVSEACQKAEEIKSMHQYLARVEQRAFLNSLGVDCDAYLNGSGSDDSEEESEDGKEDFSDTEERQVTGEENNSSQILNKVKRLVLTLLPTRWLQNVLRTMRMVRVWDLMATALVGVERFTDLQHHLTKICRKSM